jgi:hypothetical protein
LFFGFCFRIQTFACHSTPYEIAVGRIVHVEC